MEEGEEEAAAAAEDRSLRCLWQTCMRAKNHFVLLLGMYSREIVALIFDCGISEVGERE